MLYQKLRNHRYAQIFIIFTRYLIGYAFIPSGMVKLMGLRFTQISTQDPVGYFFEGLYQTGLYWQFLGAVQLVAAFLLLTQRFATFGAIMFLGVIGNIWVITLSMDFNYTYVITTLMLLANILLIMWDWNKIKPIFEKDSYSPRSVPQSYPAVAIIWNIIGFVLYILSVAAYLFYRF